MNPIKIPNTSNIIPTLYIGLEYDDYGVNCYVCSKNKSHIEGYHLFIINYEGIELSFAIGEDCDEEYDDDVIIFPPIDTDMSNGNCLKITGVDEL